MISNFKSRCDICKNTGTGIQKEIFARIFYRKINNEWKCLCWECWEKELKKESL